MASDNMLYQIKTKTLESTIKFTKEAVDRDLKVLDDDISELEESINKIVARGAKAPESMVTALEAKKQMKKKLDNDRVEVEILLRDIDKKKNDATLSEEKKYEEIAKIINPFFVTYENVYDGSNEMVEISHGNSHFKKIIKTTNTYAKLSSKIDKLEAKAEVLASKRMMKHPSKKANKKSFIERELVYTIRDLKEKQVRMQNKQKIIMLKRQSVINKKNMDMSRLEAKDKIYSATGKIKLSNIVEDKIDSLRAKKIKANSSNVVLFKEGVKTIFKHRKIDDQGNYDKRTFEQQAIDRLDEKRKRKL